MTDFLAYPSDMDNSGPEIDMLLGMLDLPRAVRDPEVEARHPQAVRRWRRILAARRAD